MKNIVAVTGANFQSEVINSAIPVLVDFFATWCGPCQMLAPILEEVAEEYQGRVKVAKVDVDQAPDLASQYGITGVPTLFIVQNGKVTQRMVGMGSMKTLRSWLEQAAQAPVKASS